MKKYIIIILIFYINFYTNLQNAKEILIYANSIEYDNNKNVVAKGNAKIISGNQILFGSNVHTAHLTSII